MANKNFRDMLRDLLTIDYVKSCKKINCSDVTSREIDNKIILSYTMQSEEDNKTKLVEMEYIDGLLNRIYKDGVIDFDYSRCE